MSAVATVDEVDTNFRATMRRFPATVTIVTASDGSRDHGMTVTAVTSVSMSPPSLMVCLNNKTLLHEMLLAQANFSVNVLSQEHPELSDAFSGKVDPAKRFSIGDWQRDPAGDEHAVHIDQITAWRLDRWGHGPTLGNVGGARDIRAAHRASVHAAAISSKPDGHATA